MINEIEMNSEMRTQLFRQYYEGMRPRLIGMTIFFWAVILVLWLVIYSKVGDDGNIWMQVGRRYATKRIQVSFVGISIIMLIVCVLFYLGLYFAIIRVDIAMLRDARLGKVIQERVHIINVIHLPSGIDINYLSSENILTVSGQYGQYKIGDVCYIYYLQHCRQLLDIQYLND
ncbi:hypothetical protein DBR32_00570 [Taibaiella sp. KBW10]|uniref:hypothetical protein n=1 Tax=Taibaiella sp. KBW10 TaxID=2153357 RepID=UPI000F5B3BCB|nr:hypothetical protein [Taibaiella sp. KBW10]RQO32141.1 hypothetical protein DBR32_00570 [Taibaiella sp. KBW10]